MRILFEISCFQVAEIPDHMVGDIRKAFEKNMITCMDDLSNFDPNSEIEYSFDTSEMEEGQTITLKDGATSMYRINSKHKSYFDY